jgi:hypothetical protein
MFKLTVIGCVAALASAGVFQNKMAMKSLSANLTEDFIAQKTEVVNQVISCYDLNNDD